MKQYVIERSSDFTDLSPIFAGEEACRAGHSFGPFVREYYLIHFCVSGCGELKDKNGTHKISAGELFVIRPGEVTTYTADSITPWKYMWLSFTGVSAEVFGDKPSVHKIPDGMTDRLSELINEEISTPEIYASFIYELMYRLFLEKESGERDDKLHKIKKYVRYNYMEKLKVADLARNFGFERSYLYRMFKERYGIGIKEYITVVRMEFAKRFLSDGYTVYESAHMVGYEDEFNFSKSFKRHFGISPSEYKSKNND